MNIFRLTGDLSHLAAIVILLLKIWKTRSCAGERRARPRKGSGAGPGRPEDPPTSAAPRPAGPRWPDTPPRPGGRAAGAWGGPAIARAGARARAGCHGAGPRSALGPLPNLSRRRRGGANQAARGPVLLGKFGRGWGLAGAPPPPALVGASRRGPDGVGAGVRRCGQPANQWTGRGRVSLTWQPGQPGRWGERGERSPALHSAPANTGL